MLVFIIQLFSFITLSLLYHPTIYAETARFDVTRDVWISAYPGEENYNMGATRRLKLKGIQEMAILDFDLSSLKGKKVEGARLYFCNAGKKNKLRKIGISTVASPWTEGRSRRPAIDAIGRGATFYYSSYKMQRWAGNKSDLTDVTMGNGNTWQHHTEIKEEGNGWWSVDVASELIQALIAGKSHGLLIMDESGQTLANNYVFSRESGRFSPYMMVTYSDIQKEKPEKPHVELVPSLEDAHMEYGAAVLKIFLREDIFAYDLFINGEEVPLWRVPKPVPTKPVRKSEQGFGVGVAQEIVIDWLPPEKKIEVEIMAVDELGQRSEPAYVSGYSSRSLPKISLPAYPLVFSPIKEGIKERSIQHKDALRVWALPDVTKVDPVSGRVLFENSEYRFNTENPVWSAEKKEIALFGIKGEVIGFQLCVEGGGRPYNGLKFNMPTLVNDTGDQIPAERFSLYRVHYLKVKDRWYPELAIPLYDGRLAVRPIKNQKNQLIYVDLSIPRSIKDGTYRGEIVISRNGKKEKVLYINLSVADVLMPEQLSFVPELNMYSGPGRAGTEKFFNAHRIAHEHRAVINRVPYSQNGKVHKDMIPAISYTDKGGIEIDWTDYDRRLGPLFDGTAFLGGERKGIPVEKFYLPFFENWPVALAEHYQYKDVKRKTQDVISEHALNAPPLDKALTPQYKERFIQVVRKFKEHFEEKGWDRTEFQFYLNNKWKWKGASSWWKLDEAMSYDDWMALRFFGLLFHEARGATPLKFIFRADVSRPRWQRDWLNGILERMYVNNKVFFGNPDRIRRMKKEGQINFSVYGSLNDIASSNQRTVLWCIRAFVEGADGVLPWQSLGGARAFSVPDRNALIVDAEKTLDVDWIVSLRVKALRRGQQDVELLAMLEKKYGYKREQVRDFFYRYFSVKRSIQENNSTDSVTLEEADTLAMENFRRTLIGMLSVR